MSVKEKLTAKEKKYRKILHNRKFRLFIVLYVAFTIVLVQSSLIFIKSDSKKLKPQVGRAVKQLSSLLPQLEQNEQALREAYDNMNQNLESIFTTGTLSNSGLTLADDIDLDLVIDDSLSWMDRVTGLKVGRDGYMFVVSKDSGKIIAHPDGEYVGHSYLTLDDIKDEKVVYLNSIEQEAMAEDLSVALSVIKPKLLSTFSASAIGEIVTNLKLSMVGVAIEYGDTYIVCGIPMTEILLDVIINALVFSISFLTIMWLFIKWICLVTDTRRETVKSFRTKLISYGALTCMILFCMSWYMQVMSNVTDDLKTMDKHADVAVETLNTYRSHSQKLNEKLDAFYIAQSKIAGIIVNMEGKENLTRDDMRRYAEELNVKYIYLYDQQGNVLVTNSPYDHLALSENPEDPTNAFRALLDGVSSAISKPFYDEALGEELQYIGVSLRNDEDLCDGLVMIAVDTKLRERLLHSLTVETVLSNMIIGLPDYAVAVDKSDLKIDATTGMGFVGDPIGSLGITEDNLIENFNGYVKYDGKIYYAGVSETEDMYLIPIVRRSSKLSSFIVAFTLGMSSVVTTALIVLFSLYKYQRDVIDSAPEEKEEESSGKEAEINIEDNQRGIFSEITNYIHSHHKKGLEERWHINTVPKEKQTPEQRIVKIIYWLLLIFCLFILLPTVLIGLDQNSPLKNVSHLSFILSGNWQKGLNIFALTACLFLFCVMYVCVVFISRMLYMIAKISSMRVETICLLIRNSLKYICVVIFIYYGLAQFGVDTKTLLASAGILTLMISFGAKDLISDIIAGFFIILEGCYKVGDFISVNGWIGTVVEIGLRTTRVRFYSDTKIFNNSSMRDLINSDGEIGRMVLSIPVGYDADLEEVEKILEEELPKLKDVIPGLVKAPLYEGVDSFGQSGVMIRIAIYMETPYRYSAFRALQREIKLIFDRRGIEIPLNQIVVHEAHD